MARQIGAVSDSNIPSEHLPLTLHRNLNNIPIRERKYWQLFEDSAISSYYLFQSINRRLRELEDTRSPPRDDQSIRPIHAEIRAEMDALRQDVTSIRKENKKNCSKIQELTSSLTDMQISCNSDFAAISNQLETIRTQSNHYGTSLEHQKKQIKKLKLESKIPQPTFRSKKIRPVQPLQLASNRRSNEPKPSKIPRLGQLKSPTQSTSIKTTPNEDCLEIHAKAKLSSSSSSGEVDSSSNDESTPPTHPNSPDGNTTELPSPRRK